MCWFYGTLGDRVRHEEEIEFSILDFGLLDETLVDVSALRRILNKLTTLMSLFLLEETLTDAFVNDNQRDFWGFIILNWGITFWCRGRCFLFLEVAVFRSYNFM